MKHISNIRDLKIMYITTSIAVQSFEYGELFNLDNTFKYKNDRIQYFIQSNLKIYNLFISNWGSISDFKYSLHLHYFLKLNEFIYDKFDDKQKIIKKNDIGKFIIDEFNENTGQILYGKGDKNKYYSLIFLAIPFALKIHNKNKLISSLHVFLKEIIDEEEHILATITCSLFIHYALNDIKIEDWIENINKDLKDLSSEKYLDQLNNYYELNFRNNIFVEQKIEDLVDVRNKIFFDNYCNKNNRILSENPAEQVLLIYDTLIRSRYKWDKLILFGMVNYNDNISISIILGCLYEILFSSTKINKNLIKRFSF